MRNFPDHNNTTETRPNKKARLSRTTSPCSNEKQEKQNAAEGTQQNPSNQATAKTIPSSKKRVSFATQLVTSTWERARTREEEKRELFYSQEEYEMFRAERKMSRHSNKRKKFPKAPNVRKHLAPPRCHIHSYHARVA